MHSVTHSSNFQATTSDSNHSKLLSSPSIQMEIAKQSLCLSYLQNPIHPTYIKHSIDLTPDSVHPPIPRFQS